MKNIKSIALVQNDVIMQLQKLSEMENITQPKFNLENYKQILIKEKTTDLAEILFITSYPPRECGIATYSQDLIKSLENKFSNSLSIKVCALEPTDVNYAYPDEVKYTLNTSIAAEYKKMAVTINKDSKIKIVMIQHEFGFFRVQEHAFLQFLYDLTKPVIIGFHTVLPHPGEELKAKIRGIAAVCESIIVMTQTSADILTDNYGISEEKINVIAHGTHLVTHVNKKALKLKYGLKDRKVLSTFGLLSSGKSLETTIEALPAIVKKTPKVVFLIIGKTHPEVVKEDGETYREMLIQKIKELSLQDHVIFINKYLGLPELLEYLQLTDIYLFTTNDPNQAVSGTFAYAMSCACPIISTPIPHARELITKDTGIIFDFRNSLKLGEAVNHLLSNDKLRRNISINALQKIVFTAWENSAVAHAKLFSKTAGNKIILKYNIPEINLTHLKQMTTSTGIIQFSRVNQPDLSTGYTLDDNARAMVSMCMYYKLAGDNKCVKEIKKYLAFIKNCQQPEGNFLNYIDKDLKFTGQNKTTNLEDSNGRAIWSLGYLISMADLLPIKIITGAKEVYNNSLRQIDNMNSPRAMAFVIKGIYYSQSTKKSPEDLVIFKTFAQRLVRMYKHESSKKWDWFEGYLTYANSILPEAMLYAWLLTGEAIYKRIAVSTFDFLLSKIFNENGIEVISNKTWLKKGEEAGRFGEQPIDVAYTVMALNNFYDVIKDEAYRVKMEIAFNWFLGQNRLNQIIYNPCTGGCYDGLEEFNVNLNQGAESTVSYLMARLTIEKYQKKM
jgi:glycosyltransferase involved in cell wall biosynthesis